MARSHLTNRIVAVGMAATMAAALPLDAFAQRRPPGYPDGDRSDAPSAPWSEPRERDRGKGNAGTIAVIGLIGIAALCAAKCKSPKREAGNPQDAELAQRLLRDGPIVVDEYTEGVVVMYGFVKNGWPVVIDYATAPGADASLTISLDGRDWTIPLGGGRQQVKFAYQGGGAAESRPALFVLRSSLWAADGSERPQDIDLIGFGCGPRAVGSVAINSLSFRTSMPTRLGLDYANFGFAAASPFSRIGMEVLHYTARPDGNATLITVAPVAAFQESARPRGPYGPRVWNGLDQTSGRASRGLHRLRVRAWDTSSDRSWVAAVSRDAVIIP